MTFLSIYLVIGLIWTLSMEILISRSQESTPMTNLDRTLNTLFWPIISILFCFVYFKKEKDDE